ncbi:hypothetical protein EV424DRAFT_1571443 [Suillus variegatus]|nr:hypothetical protein EV424DRAFT_1571443 [Suillus variegatus]
MAFHQFVIAHCAMIERRVLYGDLSPNNFVIHKGTGYFIDFDHAAILAVNMTSTYSPGTGTMPYISIRILQSMMNMTFLDTNTNLGNINPGEDIAPANDVQRLIEHKPSDDLESLFYIFFEFVANAYEALGKADLRGLLGTCCFAKVGVVLDPNFMVKLTSDYFAAFRPLIQQWQTLVCLANKPNERERIETTHEKVLEILIRSTSIVYPPIPEAGPSKLPLRRSAQESQEVSLNISICRVPWPIAS